MPEPIRKKMKVEVAPKPSEKLKEPKKKETKIKKEVPKEVPKKVAKKDLPIWNFPLKQRSVRAKDLQEATEKVNAKE